MDRRYSDFGEKLTAHSGIFELMEDLGQSLAAGGMIELGLTVEQLTERLANLFRRFRTTMALPAPVPGARVSGKAD